MQIDYSTFANLLAKPIQSKKLNLFQEYAKFHLLSRWANWTTILDEVVFVIYFDVLLQQLDEAHAWPWSTFHTLWFQYLYHHWLFCDSVRVKLFKNLDQKNFSFNLSVQANGLNFSFFDLLRMFLFKYLELYDFVLLAPQKLNLAVVWQNGQVRAALF